MAEIEVEHHAMKSYGYFDAPRWLWERQVPKAKIPITGTTGPSVKDFESTWCNVMQRWTIPGSTVAVAKNGQLIYVRGFGHADINTSTPMPPDALFRIASISKAITSVAALKLCEQGKLSLDTKVIPLLKVRTTSEHPDPQLSQITLRNLLQCTAGWDRTISGDPMFLPLAREAALQCSPTMRPTVDAIAQYWLGRRLDFIPDSHFAYSNFSYALVGKAIEKVTGRPYEEYVRTEILKPMNIASMRPGKTVELYDGETTYYPFPGQEENNSVFPNFKGKVPLSYGGDFSLECMTADTGWISNAADLVRFISAVAGDTNNPPLNSVSMKEMLKRPEVPEWKDKKRYFAMGWEADSTAGDKIRFSRQGSLPGTLAFVAHTPDGYAYAFCCNSRPFDSMSFEKEAELVLDAAVKRHKFDPATVGADSSPARAAAVRPPKAQ